jgi:hypothetical protein
LGEHKRLFATHSVRCANVYYLKISAKTRFLVIAHLIVSRTSRRIVAMSDWLGVKAQLRQRLHRTSPPHGDDLGRGETDPGLPRLW